MGFRTWLGLKRPKQQRRSVDSVFEPWFSDKDLTTDWAFGNFGTWTVVLGPERPTITHILEVGSWEGGSAIFFLNFFPSSNVTCIDTFAGSPTGLDRNAFLETAPESERRFDANTAAFGSRVRKIKGRSVRELDRLVEETESFDLIYIDGDHTRDAVLIDSLLAWKLLRPGGVLIWDDYKWKRGHPENMRPQPAIDLFVSLYCNALTKIHVGSQLIIRRTD